MVSSQTYIITILIYIFGCARDVHGKVYIWNSTTDGGQQRFCNNPHIRTRNYKHCLQDGVYIVSTPNAFFLSRPGMRFRTGSFLHVSSGLTEGDTRCSLPGTEFNIYEVSPGPSWLVITEKNILQNTAEQTNKWSIDLRYPQGRKKAKFPYNTQYFAIKYW